MEKNLNIFISRNKKWGRGRKRKEGRKEGRERKKGERMKKRREREEGREGGKEGEGRGGEGREKIGPNLCKARVALVSQEAQISRHIVP